MIWVQVLLLRAAVRAAYGKGVQYHWSVSPNGRVFLTSIDWMPSQKAARDWLTPPHTSARLVAACDGSALRPPYAGLSAHPCAPTAPACTHGASVLRVPARNLPLPDT